MLELLFPSGSVMSVNSGDNIDSFADSYFSKKERKSLIAYSLNGIVYDLSEPIRESGDFFFVMKDTPEGLEILRHDCAHVLAQAVQELFPETQVTFGPTTDVGFYYDFFREEPFQFSDLALIEDRMRDIVRRALPISREIWERDVAIEFFKNKKEIFKAEWISEIGSEEPISIYKQGDSWLDLCKGPHAPNTGCIGETFRLTKLSGSYWRGDASGIALQRIYGVYFSSTTDLQKYFRFLEEVKERDHRKIGQDLSLFHFQEEGYGSVFWHPNGYTLYETLKTYMRHYLTKNDYHEVMTPVLLCRSLWEDSGHWEKFRENMFLASHTMGDDDGRVMALKPMNCPAHIQIFKKKTRSYKDLPLRFAEFGSCHRYEPSGSLHGLMRLRAFVQDDAHIFCTEDQIISETMNFALFLKKVYSDLGFSDFYVRFSDRPTVRAGDDSVWDKAEDALRKATVASGLEYKLLPGEGAFYGPKLEFVLRDALLREWQCGTLQVDFILPVRLGAVYMDAEGKQQHPVMLHRAILGSFERFIGILIENYKGAFPIWLAPVQVMVLSVSESSIPYAEQVLKRLKDEGIRAKIDSRNDTIAYKVRQSSHEKVPLIWVVGEEEIQNQSVTVRTFGSKSTYVVSLDEAIRSVLIERKMP